MSVYFRVGNKESSLASIVDISRERLLRFQGLKGLNEKHYKKLSRAVYLGENLRDIAMIAGMD